jgi:hypothetical protein
MRRVIVLVVVIVIVIAAQETGNGAPICGLTSGRETATHTHDSTHIVYYYYIPLLLSPITDNAN